MMYEIAEWIADLVSIQPKPKKGLVGLPMFFPKAFNKMCFNPAEAEEGFSR